jgi:hypothetical protein
MSANGKPEVLTQQQFVSGSEVFAGERESIGNNLLYEAGNGEGMPRRRRLVGRQSLLVQGGDVKAHLIG